MGWTIELSGDSLSRFRYTFQLAAFLLLVLYVAFPLDGPARVLLAVLFASQVAVTAVGLWRTTTDGDGPEQPRTAEDITHDPFADPGQAARDRWEQAVRRLPGRDDDRD
jgi:hypothetical protein